MQGQAKGQDMSQERLLAKGLWRGRSSLYHEKRSHRPVHDDAKEHLFPHGAPSQELVERLVPDLAEDRIHHD